ncbi:polyprenyl synthetase family protein [Dietzia sp.]|uniref:polyprenyl synthetase family protein n=1 Tax=Dietzia sp. TaxID=1871616 RepID=UPI002FDA3EA3
MESNGPASTGAAELIGSALERELSDRIEELAGIDERCAGLGERIRAFVEGGGKRMRPLFALAAYEGCAGKADRAGAVGRSDDTGTDGAAGSEGASGTAEAPVARASAARAVAALELIQACALIHDDIIDSSATRRGVSTVHVALAEWHRDNTLAGDSADYGRNQAILLGDIALAWADDMFSGALLDSPGIDVATLRLAHAAWSGMRTEVLGGQMLDVHAEATGARDLDTPAKVNRYKTAAYTIERPVHIGALLAGADEATIASLREFGVAIGLAFQLVDDLLGVFGDPAVTGKPSGDDLREGKRTVLINRALETAPPAEAAELEGLLGRELSPAEFERARAILRDCGAVAHVEAEIERLTADGTAALDAADLAPGGRAELGALAARAVKRTF